MLTSYYALNGHRVWSMQSGLLSSLWQHIETEEQMQPKYLGS